MDDQDYSVEILNRAKTPKYLGSEADCNSYLDQADHFYCHYHFPNSNGEITVYGLLNKDLKGHPIKSAKYFTNIKGAPLAFVDAMIELSHKRDSHSLPLLSFREIESFLRDSNDRPAFLETDTSFYRYFEMLSALKNSINKDTFIAPTNTEKKSPTATEYEPHSITLFDPNKMGPFKALDVDLKIDLVNKILTAHVRDLLKRDGGDVECAHVMGDLVVLNFLGNCGTCGMSLTTTMDFIKKVLHTETYDNTLSIISDS